MKKPYAMKAHRSNRKDLVEVNENKDRSLMHKVIDNFRNQINSFQVHLEFSHIFREAQRKYGLRRFGLYDIDLVIFNHEVEEPVMFLELKSRYDVEVEDELILFEDPQWHFAKTISRKYKVPYYWIIKTWRHWIIFDTNVKAEVGKVGSKYLVRIPKNELLILDDYLMLNEWLGAKIAR